MEKPLVSNETSNDLINQIGAAIPKSTPYWFFTSLAAAIFWTLYLAYYNSRVIGMLATLVINKFYKYGHINIGSLSISVLSGKVMFRDVHYITEDFSIRIDYGWVIFRWWRPYVHKELGEDMSHSETKLFSFIDGLEMHVYNRSATYDQLEKMFGLNTGMDDIDDPVEQGDNNDTNKTENSTTGKNKGVEINKTNWRDLLPVCKFEIVTCRFVFGNHLVPNTLIFHLDDSHVTYTTTPPTTPFDTFMHDVKVKADNMRIMFVRSDKYKGEVDEPPRMMGEGFVIMQSTEVKFHFYMDQPGTVPLEPERVELADGEPVMTRTYPTIALDVECGKNTDFNYGPWADRQREYLWKFFYPSDYQSMVPTKVPEPGELRQFKTFEFRMNILAEATNDVLFTKNSETQAIHMNMGQGSYIESSIPWVTREDGYTTVIRGQLLLLEATTSMKYRSLLYCETLDFNVSACYPLEWNSHQEWKYSFSATKATVYLIFEHKYFFSDLIDDWSTKSVPDVFHFVPYSYNINILINQFELVTLCNEYNWIDTSSQNPENAHIAFCGEMFDLSLQLPYTDFLPVTNAISFIFKVETVFCRLYLPENNTSRHVVIALSENMKILDRDGNLMNEPFCYDIKKQWRRLTERSAGWVDCWKTSNVSITIVYTYHPMPPLLKQDTSHILSPSTEDLTNMPESPDTQEFIPRTNLCTDPQTDPNTFDAGTMDPDMITVELEVAPSVLCVYGALLRNFLHVKENYLGEDQKYTDFYDTPSATVEVKEEEGLQGPLTDREVAEREFDHRKYRPFGVVISVTLHDIQAHLVKNCNEELVPCPSVYIERVGFEMDKRYDETKLQVLISPAVLIARDAVERDPDQIHLKDGHLALSGLQVRGHAMFSHKGLPLESETLEYAWSVEAVIGDLSGRLTSPQIQGIVEFVQTFIMLVEDVENSLQRAISYQLCQHMLPQHVCKQLSPKYNLALCLSSEDIKYRLTRASVDSVNLFLVEGGTALNVQVFPVRLATCNLHGDNTRAGITGLIEHISFKQYISTAPIRHNTSQPETWIESGGLSLGPIKAEAAMALPNQDFHNIQHQFLTLHDASSKRLWFLWPPSSLETPSLVLGKCGCIGGCAFFGANKNGIDFFNPKKHHEVTPTAVFKVSPEGMDPGFGQSLLHKNRLVFEVGTSAGFVSPNKEFAFTRGYMSEVATPDTPGTSITVIEECVANKNSNVNTNTLHPGRPNEPPPIPSRSPRVSYSPTTESQSTSGSIAPTSPTEAIPSDASNMNPFDTIKSTDPAVLRESEVVTDGWIKSARSISLSTSSPPPFSPTLRSSIAHSPSSRSSVRSPSSAHSGSPVLVAGRHSHKFDPGRQTSIVSLDSEMYFSAEEDALSSSDPAFATLKRTSIPDIQSMSSDSPNLSKGGNSPSLYMNNSNTSDFEPTVIERNSSSSLTSNSTLSYLSIDTDAEDTLSGGIPDELSMVDLHSQVR